MDEKTKAILEIPEKDLGKGSSIKLEILEDDKDICYDMALNILVEVWRNNKKEEKTVFIWPVGPVGQYPILARLANQYGISFKNVHVFQMDEYLDDSCVPVPLTSPFSFTIHIREHFLKYLDEKLRLPLDQIYVPTPGKEDLIMKKIEELGGIDTAYGGIGINGHIAFNEPPAKSEAVTDEDFCGFTTRVLSITTETRITNAHTAARGAIDLIPSKCITIGMKEILSSKRIRFYCNRDWQSGIIRKILHGEVTRFVPASFFQRHPDAVITITKAVAQAPIGMLR